MAKRVQVVLNSDVLSLGKNGDLVEVAPGYARNFLVPSGKAQPVTAAVLRQVEARRAKEVFLTGTTTFVMPVVQIDDQPVANGTPGTIALDLRQRYVAFMDHLATDSWNA